MLCIYNLYMCNDIVLIIAHRLIKAQMHYSVCIFILCVMNAIVLIIAHEPGNTVRYVYVPVL
jgi:hypothetical protein